MQSQVILLSVMKAYLLKAHFIYAWIIMDKIDFYSSSWLLEYDFH